MTRYLHHITLQTGQTERQYRDQVSDKAVQTIADLLTIAMMGGNPALPSDDGGWTMTAAAHGKCLQAAIWRGDDPIITTGVALKSRSAQRLWRLMHEDARLPVVTSINLPPPVPWIADRIEPGAAQHQQALSWTGDWSRCVGWAWSEQ